MKLGGWNAPCAPERLGAKHKRVLEAQFGRWTPMMDTHVTLGQWYVIAKPEHIVNPMQCDTWDMALYSMLIWDSMEPPYWECPFCGNGNLKVDQSALAMAPMPCHSCMRVGWVFYPESEAYWFHDYYIEQLDMVQPSNTFESWDRYGIPAEIFEIWDETRSVNSS